MGYTYVHNTYMLIFLNKRRYIRKSHLARNVNNGCVVSNLELLYYYQHVFLVLLHGNDCKATNVSIEIQHHVSSY